MRDSRIWRAAAIAVLALAATPRPAPGWGDNGHRVVGRIAEERLSPAARQTLAGIAGRLSLEMLATWPDFIRSEPGWDFAEPWHYVTVEDGDSLAAVMERSAASPEPDNVVEAIEYMAAILGGDGKRRRSFERLMRAAGVRPYRGSTELTALAFLAHFIGDVHQPLHVGRGGDRGGNQIMVNWFGEVERLHSVWDSGFIEHLGLSYSELADFLERELGDSLEPGDGGPRDWARESLAYRGKLYEIWGRTSRENYLPELGWEYRYRHLGRVKRGLYLAGRRLAALLESILAPPP